MAFGKYARPHQKLDSSEAHVSKSVVPLQPFLFYCTPVHMPDGLSYPESDIAVDLLEAIKFVLMCLCEILRLNLRESRESGGHLSGL
jgi:hypothetical protein